jgi:predicted nucleic-acid-binding protein
VIGLDTNVVVRYLVQDDPEQSGVSSELIDQLTETDPGYLSLVTVVELHWVLRRAYHLEASRCAELIGALLDARELRVDQDEVVRVAVTAAAGGVDFGDAVITELGRANGCAYTVTFDRSAARHRGMRLLGSGKERPDR